MDELKKNFKQNGYVLIKNFYNDLELKKISEISKKVLNKARTGSWEHIRIYRDYPNFFNKLNLFGVDYPLHSFLDKETYNEFQKLNYKDYILDFLEWKNFYTPLIRLHTNSSFYNYQGEWHRDDPNFPSENSVQVIIYLLDEKGYRIIPKHKNDLLEKYGMSKTNVRTEGKGFAKLPKEIYDIVDAKKGDILIHESALLHQGFCKKRRLHYHLRHIRSDKYNNHMNGDNFNFDEKFMENYDLKKLKNKAYIQLNKRSIFLHLNRLKTLFFYFFPRFKSLWNNLTKKEKQSIFHSTIWQ